MPPLADFCKINIEKHAKLTQVVYFSRFSGMLHACATAGEAISGSTAIAHGTNYENGHHLCTRFLRQECQQVTAPQYKTPRIQPANTEKRSFVKPSCIRRARTLIHLRFARSLLSCDRLSMRLAPTVPSYHYALHRSCALYVWCCNATSRQTFARYLGSKLKSCLLDRHLQ